MSNRQLNKSLKFYTEVWTWDKYLQVVCEEIIIIIFF